MKYEVEANTERAISEHVIKYAATIITTNKLVADGFSKSDNKYKIITKLQEGKYHLDYENNQIEIDYKKYYEHGNKIEQYLRLNIIYLIF